MFFKYTRMTVECFYILLEMVSPKLEKQNWRALPSELVFNTQVCSLILYVVLYLIEHILKKYL